MWKNGYAILPVYSIMNSISCPGDRQRQRYKVFLREGTQMNEQFIQGIIFDWNFDGIEAYARALPRGTTFPTVSIGRVIAVKRRCGLGSKIVDSAIDVARETPYRSNYHRSLGLCPFTIRETGVPADAI